MNYYIIYLLDGEVVDISSWDEEDGRDRQFSLEQGRLDTTRPWGYNQVQTLNQVR